jgi:hypothetical protein
MSYRSIVAGAAGSILAVVAVLSFVSPAAASAPVKPAPVPAGGAGDPVVTPQHCGGHTPHNDIDQRSYARLFTGDSVNIRAYPHVGCASHGYGYRTHTVDYHCWRYGDPVTRNGLVYETWTYLRNVTTGVSGWVSDAYLAGNGDGTTGSTVHCDA